MKDGGRLTLKGQWIRPAVHNRRRENRCLSDFLAMIFTCLGNSEKKYSKTRHNIGRMFGEWLAAKSKVKNQKSKIKSGKIFDLENGRKVVISECFMNQSGPAVKKLLKILNIKSEILNDLYLIHDDLDLPFGEFKIQFGRGAAGHHGVESVIEALGTNQFWRIRIGIGKPPAGIPPENYVLMPFSKEEEESTGEIFERIVKEIKLI